MPKDNCGLRKVASELLPENSALTAEEQLPQNCGLRFPAYLMVGDRALLEQQYNYRIIIRIFKVETDVILNQQICDVTGVPLKEFKRRIARLRHTAAAFANTASQYTSRKLWS